RAETRSAPAVGVAGAGPEAVLRGVRLAHLRTLHRDHLIGARDALAVVDERLARDARGGRACRRRALHAPRIAAKGENVLVDASWCSGRLRRRRDDALARLLAVLLQLDRQGGRCGGTREPVARRREAERGPVTLPFDLDPLQRRRRTVGIGSVGADLKGERARAGRGGSLGPAAAPRAVPPSLGVPGTPETPPRHSSAAMAGGAVVGEPISSRASAKSTYAKPRVEPRSICPPRARCRVRSICFAVR